jgi:hypothetical protein
MRQIHQIHNAENQRQSGGKQEQEQAELQAVQELFDKEQHAFWVSASELWTDKQTAAAPARCRRCAVAPKD